MVRKETVTDALSSSGLAALCRIVYEDSGIVLDESKRYLLETRLRPVADARGLGMEQLSQLVRLDRALRYATVEAMTTNETLFFRDVAPFDALRTVLIPELVERRAAVKRLSIWCAACSTGQEPYSIAMLLKESQPRLADWKIDILGTDISEVVLARARKGRFGQLEVNRGLPVQHLVKYFRRDGLIWELKPEVRAMVRFESFNLKESMHRLGPFDVVFCRNVLIYFDVELKKKILAGIRGVLAADGCLLLGGAETVFHLDDLFERRAIGQASVYKMK